MRAKLIIATIVALMFPAQSVGAHSSVLHEIKDYSIIVNLPFEREITLSEQVEFYEANRPRPYVCDLTIKEIKTLVTKKMSKVNIPKNSSGNLGGVTLQIRCSAKTTAIILYPPKIAGVTMKCTGGETTLCQV